MRGLIDVDGVVADLMGGFGRFLLERHGVDLRQHEITTHRLSRSPAHQEIHARLDLNVQLADFLALPNPYEHVALIEYAQEGIGELMRRGDDVAFITATLHESPQSYAPKYRWLDRHFRGIPVISCPAGQKSWLHADYGIDDRYDTCQRWTDEGVRSLLFRQPWNEAPDGHASYDWRGLVRAIDAIR